MPAAAARWIVPAAVTALVVGGGVAASATSDATPDLPERSAEELLAAVGEAEPTPFSGTVRTVADLGLPSLGDLGAVQGESGGSATDPASVVTRLLSGENQLRVWVGGPEQQRVSVVDDFAELDVRRDGDVAWTYSSADDTATRYDLAEMEARLEAAHEAEHGADATAEAPELPTEAAPYAGMTPDEVARRLVAEAEPTTEIAVGDTQVVAGRDAYTLTMTPRDEATLVGTVEVAVDAETGLVLQVEVGARDQEAPAWVSGFTDLQLGAPDAEVFAFTPAPGTTVLDAVEEAERKQAEVQPVPERPAGSELSEAQEPVVHGDGWSTVVELQLPEQALAAGAGAEAGGDPEARTEDVDPAELVGRLTTEVEGGRVLSSALLTVLLTEDGRVLVGSVDAATLQSYAG